MIKRVGLVTAAVALAATVVWYLTRPQAVSVSLITADLGAVTATVTNTRAGTVDAQAREGLQEPLGVHLAGGNGGRSSRKLFAGTGIF